MWVARDKDNILHLFLCKPSRIGDEWYFDGESLKLFGRITDEFENIRWEDEPVEVNLISTDNIDNELNDMFCQLCVDYKIPDSVADKLINIFKSNVGSKR